MIDVRLSRHSCSVTVVIQPTADQIKLDEKLNE